MPKKTSKTNHVLNLLVNGNQAKSDAVPSEAEAVSATAQGAAPQDQAVQPQQAATAPAQGSTAAAPLPAAPVAASPLPAAPVVTAAPAAVRIVEADQNAHTSIADAIQSALEQEISEAEGRTAAPASNKKENTTFDTNTSTGVLDEAAIQAIIAAEAAPVETKAPEAALAETKTPAAEAPVAAGKAEVPTSGTSNPAAADLNTNNGVLDDAAIQASIAAEAALADSKTSEAAAPAADTSVAEAPADVAPAATAPAATAPAATVPAATAPAATAPAAEAVHPQEAPPEVDYEFINVMEYTVKENLLEYMHRFGVCTCSRCQADVMALALTRLPAKYIVVPKNAVSPLLSFYSGRFNVSLMTELTKACFQILDNPRH